MAKNKDKYLNRISRQKHRAKFLLHPEGWGVAFPEDPDLPDEVVVPRKHTLDARTGDIVELRLDFPSQKRRRGDVRARVLEIIVPAPRTIVGTLETNGAEWLVRPDGRGPVGIYIVDPSNKSGAQLGSKVVADVLDRCDEQGVPYINIVRELGTAGDFAVETRSMIYKYDLVETFPPSVLESASEAAAAPIDLETREDLTERTIITIDPPDARDFDDAISIERTPKGFELGVHIADVSYYVEPGSPIDAHARECGTSVYFPHRVLPMLPQELSNGVCSLQEGVLRPTLSAFISYDMAGQVKAVRFSESVIKSSKRLTYIHAQKLIEGVEADVDEKIVLLLRDMDALARIIEARRRRDGMIHLDLPEVNIELSLEGSVSGATTLDESYTHKIIEMFMVEANEAVASAFADRQWPILRRVHPEPEPEVFDRLESFVRACGHSLATPPSPFDLRLLVERVHGAPESYAINLAILRTFTKAHYSPVPIGHYALASENYCHFTSPIRRYPDLEVHRQLRQLLRGQEPADFHSLYERLEDLGALCSDRERAAEDAEKELKQVMILHHLAEQIGEQFEGIITWVASHGIFVQHPDYFIEGMIRLSDLGDEWFEVSQRYGLVRGERTGRVLRIGDSLSVKIARVDVPDRHLDLTPLGEWAGEPSSTNGRSIRREDRSKGPRNEKPQHRRQRKPRDSDAPRHRRKQGTKSHPKFAKTRRGKKR